MRSKILTAEELKEKWLVIRECYDETRGSNPAETLKVILGKIGEDACLQTFATVAEIKKNDGRISPANRTFLRPYFLNEKAAEWEAGNPLIRAELDHIHTTHIDQLISELTKTIKLKA